MPANDASPAGLGVAPVISVPPPGAVHDLSRILRTIRGEDLGLSGQGARVWRGIQGRLAALLASRGVRSTYPLRPDA